MLRNGYPSLAKQYSVHERYTTPFLKSRHEADTLYGDGSYEMAMARYQEAAKMPLSDIFPNGNPKIGWVTDHDLRHSARLGVAKCLIKLGRLDEMEMEQDRLNQNLKTSSEGLERMRRWNWGEYDNAYWMLRDAREDRSNG